MANTNNTTSRTRSPNLINGTFSWLTVVASAPTHPITGHRQWLCICKCGASIVVRGSSLLAGSRKSCGCMKTGASTHPLYDIWYLMLRRCNSPKDASFHRYGGRGIKVCPRWEFGENGQLGVECFATDMGERPENTTLDRINNDGGYAPDNCRWATRKEQANNQAKNVFMTVNGISMTISQWSHQTGIDKKTLTHRLRHQWPEHKLLSTPKPTGR